MSKFKIINLIDKIFITIASFLIIYAWINFYIRDLSSTFILSAIFSLAFTYILFYFLERKKDKKLSTTKQNEEINKNFLAFRLMSVNEKLNIINQILSLDFETKKTSKNIIYKKENLTHCLVVATNFSLITQEDLISIIEQNNKKVDCIEIICNEVGGNVNANLIKNLKINFINKAELYNEFFVKSNIYPNTSILNEKEFKLNWKNLIKNILQEQKTKRYFILGFVLIFSSLILPFKTYYLIFGTGFLMCSILCKLIAKFKR